MGIALTSRPLAHRHDGTADDLGPLLGVVSDLAVTSAPEDRRVSRTDARTAALLGGSFVVFAVVCLTRASLPGWHSTLLAVTLVGLYGIAYRTNFVAATGGAVPTEPVLVALLFCAPIAVVPALVLVGLFVAGNLDEGVGGRGHQTLVRAMSGWHCAGPVFVLWIAHLHLPLLDRWPVLVAALAAQFVGDAAVAVVRCVALGTSPTHLVHPLAFTFAVDALLAPLAVAVLLATHGSPAVVLFVALPVGLLRLLSVDRNQHLSTAVSLGHALQSVRAEARADPMTGLANRRAWQEAVALAEEQVQSGRGPKRTAIVLMADIDHLKPVNDTYGHDAGDELLRAFAATFVATAPEGAVLARLGGDEFAMLLTVPSESAPVLSGLAARLKAGLATCRLSCGETVSASIGMAACPPLSSVSDAIRRADAASAAEKRTRGSRGQARPELRLDRASGRRESWSR